MSHLFCYNWTTERGPDSHMERDIETICRSCTYKSGDICLKVGGAPKTSGVCGDVLACADVPGRGTKAGRRKTGAAYRRRMQAVKKRRLAYILRHTNCSLMGGPYLSNWSGEEPFYIKYPDIMATRCWTEFKRKAARKVRHSRDVPNGNAYKKYEDNYICW